MARPGIMLYFDMLEPVRVLPDAEKGRLLVAMLEYGQFGKLPEFQGMLALAWAFVKPKLDRDGQSYDNAKLQRKYAAFCRQRAARELPKIPFQQWLDEGQRHETGDDEPERPVDARYPATAATETTASDTASDTASAAAAAVTTASDTASDSASAAAAAEGDAAAAAAESTVNVIGGKLGKNVVFLSQAQMEDMLDRMGLEAFDYYVDKLSSFIIKNDAHVKNHYETMLRWWQEDGRRADAERRR